MKKWNFPNNGCGQTRGVSDAGIETFSGNEIQALAREICQNSLDAAADDKNFGVRVEFQRYTINSNQIPGFEDYKDKIEKANKYWGDRKSIKTKSFVEKAKAFICSPKAYVLRISDYNTTGLRGPYSDLDDGWNALTKLDGGATKSGDKAGAFGIGKNAPFCNSNYRLVFYRTLNDEGEKAAQGISRFISFPEDINNPMKTMTTGIGYYGNPEGNLPIDCIQELDELNPRNEIGTDVFVYGFNSDKTSKAGVDWKDSISAEILENFLMSIYKGYLNVSVDNQEINKDNLHDLIDRLGKNTKDAWSYYQVLTSPDTKEFTNDFHGLGTLRLRVLVNPSMKLNRKVLISRTCGMRLFDRGSISRAISFSGILEMEGAKLIEIFREMENPSHDSWSPSRYEDDPALAKKLYSDLKDWISNTILKLGEFSGGDELEVEGLSGILQKDDSPIKDGEGTTIEKLQDSINTVLVQPRNNIGTRARGLFHGQGEHETGRNKTTQGTITDKGDKGAVRKLGGTRKRKKLEKHTGEPEIGGRDRVQTKEKTGGDKALENVRIMKVDSGKYRVSFVLPRDIKAGDLEIVTVGENGKANKLRIKNATGRTGCAGVKAHNGGISFDSMVGDLRVSVEFELMDTREYAMEVNIYEHN